MLIAINLQKYRPIGRLHLLKNYKNCTYIYISLFVERFCLEKNRFSETVIFFCEVFSECYFQNKRHKNRKIGIVDGTTD